MVRTGNVDFSCKRLTSIEIRKSKYHIIRRVRFRWDPPRKISGSALAANTSHVTTSCVTLLFEEKKRGKRGTGRGIVYLTD